MNSGTAVAHLSDFVSMDEMIEKIQQQCPEVPPILFKNLVRPHFFPKKLVHLLYAALDFLDQKSRYSIKSKEDNLEQLIVTAVSI